MNEEMHDRTKSCLQMRCCRNKNQRQTTLKHINYEKTSFPVNNVNLIDSIITKLGIVSLKTKVVFHLSAIPSL